MDIFTRANVHNIEPVQNIHDVLSQNEVSLKTKIPKSSTSENGKNWIRSLGYVERFMVGAHEYGNMTTLYSLWLDSNKYISLDLIGQAASILYRKMPNLQMLIGHRNNDLWWKESENEILNVEQIVTDDFTETFESLLKKKYNIENGPLWFIRLIELNKNEQDEASTSNTKLNQVCVFGFHHSMTDGTTNMKICKVFIHILNNLILSKPIDMMAEGTFALPLHDDLANKYMSSSSLTCLFLQRFISGILSYGAKVSQITNLYPQPSHIGASTKVIYHDFDELTTSQLLLRCKNEGVTINSAFTAAANLGMLDLINAKTLFTGEVVIRSQHIINMRRFWPKEAQTSSFGCHVSSIDISCSAHYKNHNNFWEYTRKVHSVLNKSLNESKYCLKVIPISERLNIVLCGNSWLSWLGLPSTNDNHFSISNMGNLSEKFPGTGSEVRVTKLMRSVSGHFMPSLCNHTIQTFQGKFIYSLDYFTQKIKRETAVCYAKNILSILKGAV